MLQAALKPIQATSLKLRSSQREGVSCLVHEDKRPLKGIVDFFKCMVSQRPPPHLLPPQLEIVIPQLVAVRRHQEREREKEREREREKETYVPPSPSSSLADLSPAHSLTHTPYLSDHYTLTHSIPHLPGSSFSARS